MTDQVVAYSSDIGIYNLQFKLEINELFMTNFNDCLLPGNELRMNVDIKTDKYH